MPFGRLQEDEVAWYLQEEQGVPAQSARQVAVLSNGNIARAAELVQVSQNHTPPPCGNGCWLAMRMI